MKVRVQKMVQFGELVAAAFDEAAACSTDPQEVSRLATMAVMRMTRHARGRLAPRR
ncbi:MAG: hypothetical protein M0R80_22820 [Proteobacteria bacterium]|jgi:hypothetical protein|nr:hypothetical protein [Pseudomonadota bacterium]